MKKAVILVLLYLHVAMVARSATITGLVTDARTGEILPNATVWLEHTRYHTVTGFDGRYTLNDVPKGRYEIIVSFAGYERSDEIDVALPSGDATRIVDFRMKPRIRDLQQVMVLESVEGAKDKAVLNLEKKADIIENILSSRTISLLPDVTVAGILQRVSGINVQRTSTGEGRYAIIRGMDQRYNNTLVNGIKIPSPDDKFRFVPMDMFPAELLERLEVVKSLMPSMEGDAIGGTMNLVMKNAPDELLLSVNIAGGYSTIFGERPFSAFPHSGISRKSPAELHGNNYVATGRDFSVANLQYNDIQPFNKTIGLTLGNRFLDKKLGVLISVSSQDFYRASNSDLLIPSAQPQPDNQPLFTDIYKRQYSTRTVRTGINNKINYIIDKRNKLSLYNLYLLQDEFQTRHTQDTSLGITSTAAQKLVGILNRSRWMRQNIYNSTLQGEHELSDRLKIYWSAVFSLAKSALPDMAEYKYANDVYFNSGSASHPDSILSTLQGMTRIWEHNSERDWAGYYNMAYTTKVFGYDVEWKGGLLGRVKTRANYYNEYDLVPTLVNGTPQLYTDIEAAKYSFVTDLNGAGVVTTTNSNTYHAKEVIKAAYIQAKIFLGKKWEILGGFRGENTQLSYSTVMPVNFNARSGLVHYTDILPSVQSLYKWNDRVNVRLSYFKSICRQGLYEVTPYLIPGEYFQEIGNPYLKHTRADNLDVRYEFFPSGGANELLVGAFYKYLQNPIEYFIARDGTPSGQFIQPANVDHATNYGMEAAVTKYVGLFGISANYTFTQSRIRTAKSLSYLDPRLGYAQKIANQTRPLQGQANNVGNFSILYKNPGFGLSMQASLVYTGSRIIQVSNYYDLDLWERPYTQLDLSIEQRIRKNLVCYTKAGNLTNSVRKVYLKQPSQGISSPLQGSDNSHRTLVQRDIYKMSLLFGVKYKL